MVYLKIGPVILTIDVNRRWTTHDAQCTTTDANPIVIGHLNDRVDLTRFLENCGIWERLERAICLRGRVSDNQNIRKFIFPGFFLNTRKLCRIGIHRRVTQIGGNTIMRYYCNSNKLLRAIVTLCLGEYVFFTNLQNLQMLYCHLFYVFWKGGRWWVKA